MRRVRGIPVLLAIFAIILSLASPAMSATINVTANATDTLNGTDGQCSLREAIQNINDGATTYADCSATGTYGSNDTIYLPAGTYTNAIPRNGVDDSQNAVGDLNFYYKSVTILGAGASSTIIDGNAIGRVMSLTGVNATHTVTISGVTITNGLYDTYTGGCIANSEGGSTLNLIDTVITGCSAGQTATYGGAIYNNGYLNITRCTISNSYGHTGAGIYNANGTATIANSTISGNTATWTGGGIHTSSSGNAYPIGAVTITNSTISGNYAYSSGGGIYNGGYLTADNVTITGNSVQSPVSPYAGGQGGGIHHNVGATTTITNSIVAGNTATRTDGGPNCFVGWPTSTSPLPVISGGYNIEDTLGAANGATTAYNCLFTGIGDIVTNVTSTLGALANNGGPTQTIALQAGSPAIDGGSCVQNVDQRGYGRPAGATCDIGAYEYNAVSKTYGDFNGDGTTDILWRNTSTGQNSIWLMNGATKLSGASLTTVATSYIVAGLGDFNGDGMADILWRDSSTGKNAIWFMNGTTKTSGSSLTTVNSGYSVAGIADFNGDGMADILWRNTSGNNSIWLMNGATKTSGASLTTVSTSYSVAGLGDFNGDGMADILWRSSTGANSIWLMNGSTKSSGAALTTVSTSYSVAGFGDFNGDGLADILWRDKSSGKNVVWFMNGATKTSGSSLTTVSASYSVVRVGDFNGDGLADILWRDSSSGKNVLWLMNGATKTGGGSITSVNSSSWKVKP